jgi:hypothetical protein
LTDQPKISNNYTEFEEYVNASRSKGDLAMIASRDQLTSCVPLEALVGDKVYEVRVREEIVMTGGVIKI